MARLLADKRHAKYLKVDDLNGKPLTLTVTHVADEEVGEDQKDMYVLYFREFPKGFPLNTTNGDAIADFLGTEDVDQWPGAVITFMPAKTTYGGKRVPCIRVKAARFPTGRTAAPADDTPHELEESTDDENAVL